MIDYATLAAEVAALVQGVGRAVEFQTLAAPANNATPWKAMVPVVTATIPTTAAFVPADGGLGRELAPDELVRRVRQVCLVGPGAYNLEGCTRLVDGGTTWGVDWVHCLKPGTVPLLWVVGVKQ